MTMEAEHKRPGRWHIVLGPVEKWLVSAAAAGILGMAYWLVTSVNTLLTQQAVSNTQLIAIQAQLTGVPDLSNRVGKLELQAEQNKQDIRELRQLRGVD